MNACGVRAASGARLAAMALALGLSGCVAREARRASPAGRSACDYTTCGTDARSLAKVTAANLQTPPETVTIGAIQTEFSGAVLVWQAKAKGRDYLCREGRDPGGTGGVHYVDCRRSGGAGAPATSLKAFP